MDESTLTFGCAPAVDDEETRVRLLELCEALGGGLNTRVIPHRSGSPLALARAFGAGAVDVAWASPTLVLFAPAMVGARAVASSIRQGAAFYHGVLFVRREAQIRSAWNLSGSRAAWVDQTSASGYIFARMTLASHGLDPREIFAEEIFLGSHGEVARAVLDGRADVGATYAAFEGGDPTRPLARAGYMDVAEASACRIVLSTPAIPSDLVVAKESVVEAHGDGLLRALKGLSRDRRAERAVRHVLGAEGFVAPRTGELDELREQIDAARGLGLLGE